LQLYKVCRKEKHRRIVEDNCPGFCWDRVNFLPRSCYVLDLVWEDCW